ncbi:unnamed protein product [Cyprideis torosa]|uniref:tRNA wybutosine-synthesizing protein 3 homolog n=1 Tax=Cyprideis torosa TaxID=163714 RepID=A0A7R8ZRT5_9CRUS|nr:unnamed protein product [Cyprideis torosa]CAG0893931.1 unnamed protein product [Cyprideis torosa]
MSEAFSIRKKAVLERTDESKKGSVDADICELIELINCHENYCTTSSCSGRIVLYGRGGAHENAKRGTEWLLCEHQEISPSRSSEMLQKMEVRLDLPDVFLKFEPFVLHVDCASLESASSLLSVGLQSGFKNSGMVVGNHCRRFMVAIRSATSLECPLRLQNHGPLMTELGLAEVISECNRRLETNHQRIQRLQDGFAKLESLLVDSTGIHQCPLPTMSYRPFPLKRRSERDEPLCCCEYFNGRGERAHLCETFCDCSELDDMFDRLIRRVPVPPGLRSQFHSLVEDRLRIPWPGGAKQIPLDVAFTGLIPLFLVLASFGLVCSCVFLPLLAVAIVFIHRQLVLPRLPFLSFMTLLWISLASYLYWVKSRLIVTYEENAVIMAMLLGTLYSAHAFFFISLCVFGGWVCLTSVCYSLENPKLGFLLPVNCSDVYADFSTSLPFMCSVIGMMACVPAIYALWSLYERIAVRRMMSSSKAFDSFPLADRFSLLGERSTNKLECVECTGSDLFLGFTESLIVQCTLEKNSTYASTGTSPFSVQKQNQRSLGSRRPIVALRSVSAIARLLALSDGHLQVLNSASLASTGLGIKQVSSFSLSQNPTVEDPFSVQLGVARKRCVNVYILTPDELQLLAEVSLPSPAVDFAMDGTSLCVALGAGPLSSYAIYDWTTSSSQDLFPFEMEKVTPRVIRIQKGEFLLCAPGNLGVFASVGGMSQRPPIPWLEAVSHVAYVHPFILVLNDSMLAVYSVFDSLRKQTMPYVGGVGVGNFEGRVFLWSHSAVMYLQPIPWERQVQGLIFTGRIHEALSLAVNSRSSNSQDEQIKVVLSNIRQRAGFISFAEGDFSQAFDLFLEGDLNPREIVHLFPGLLPSDTSFCPSAPPLHSLPPDINSIFAKDPGKVQKAEKALLQYLEQIKERGSLYKRDVDTAVIKLLISSQSQKLLSMLSSGSVTCAVADVLKYLEDFNRHFAAVILLRAEGRHEDALRLCQRLLLGELDDTDFPGVDWVAHYLGSLSSEDLVWRYSPMVLESSPSSVVHVFRSVLLAKTAERIPFQTRMRVEEFLRSLKSTSQPNKDVMIEEALITFLEHVVITEESQDEGFHTRLAQEYHWFITKHERPDVLAMRRKLQRHLRQSKCLNASKLLIAFESTQLFQETAILYGRMGDHERAISVLLHQLHDHEAALSYCQGEFEVHQRKKLFVLLLKAYLDPKQGGYCVLCQKRFNDCFFAAFPGDPPAHIQCVYPQQS